MHSPVRGEEAFINLESFVASIIVSILDYLI